MCKCVHFTPFLTEKHANCHAFSLHACYSIVLSQLLASVVNTLCFGDRLAIAPKRKVSSSLMLGVVSFLLAAESGITASKLTFIMTWGANE